MLTNFNHIQYKKDHNSENENRTYNNSNIKDTNLTKEQKKH